MSTSLKEKNYPELTGLPSHLQLKILEEAKRESLLWKQKYIWLKIIITIVVFSIIMTTLKTIFLPATDDVPMLYVFIACMLLGYAIIAYQKKIFRNKTNELAQKERQNICNKRGSIVDKQKEHTT